MSKPNEPVKCMGKACAVWVAKYAPPQEVASLDERKLLEEDGFVLAREYEWKPDAGLFKKQSPPERRYVMTIEAGRCGLERET